MTALDDDDEVEYSAEVDLVDRSMVAKWELGDNSHLPLTNGDEVCCPDLACCYPDYAWPLEMRKAYADASPEDQELMLDLQEQIIEKGLLYMKRRALKKH